MNNDVRSEVEESETNFVQPWGSLAFAAGLVLLEDRRVDFSLGQSLF